MDIYLLPLRDDDVCEVLSMLTLKKVGFNKKEHVYLRHRRFNGMRLSFPQRGGSQRSFVQESRVHMERA